MPEPTPLEAIFFAALEKPAGERAAWLNEACAGDEDLRHRVERMLFAQGEAGSFLESPPASLVPSPTTDQQPPERPGTQIGPYKLLQQIGEGGFGIVFMAEQTDPVRRRVALKVIKPGMDTRQVIARFEAERQALAVMDHPNIAKVLDAGTVGEGARGWGPESDTSESLALAPSPSPFPGRPYFVMELIRGVPITQHCDENNLSVRERLELFASVCQAIQHAHTKGIVHRDIKPTNVLVTRQDGQAVVKVIDFGIAKALGQQLTDKTLFTDFAQMIGTPLYMSPEQAELSGTDIDTRSDIYSLGVLLYELLTGSTPVSKQQLKHAAFDEIRRIIREDEAQKPSNRISTADAAPSIAAQRHTEPAKLTKLVRGELDWIVMKALEKDRNRRYETANGLAMDVQRYLADEPVLACPPSTWYRFGKFARRNKRTLVTTALLGVMLLAAVGAVTGTLGWVARDRAGRLEKTAEKVELALHEATTFGDRALELVDDNPYQWEATLAAALSAMKRAEALAEPENGNLDPELVGRMAALKSRLQADEMDRQFVAGMDEVRLEVAQTDGEQRAFKSAELAPRIKELFRAQGIEFPGASVQQAADLIRRRPEPIQKHMLAALDVWAIHEYGRVSQELEWLKAVLEAADADPWRRAVRGALEARNLKAVDDLVRSAPIERQPPAFLLFLVSGLPTESKLDFMQQIQAAHPGDFWANLWYAGALRGSEPPRLDEALRYLQASVALRPDSAAVHFNLGAALGEKGDLKGSVAAYRKALDVDPKYTPAYLILGGTLYHLREYNGAIVVLRKAIELHPRHEETTYLYVTLGKALRDKGDPEAEVALFKEAIALDPKNSRIHLALAYNLQEKRDLKGAVASFEKVLELEPKAPIHYDLGSFLYQLQEYDRAIAVLRKGIGLHPQDVQTDQIYLLLGSMLRQKGDADGEIALFRQAIALDPKNSVLHLNLGNALLQKNDQDGALAAYRQAIEADPKSGTPHANIGLVLQKRGDLPGALAAYRKANEVEPNGAHGGDHMEGLILQEQGDLPGALAVYRKIIDTFPKYATVHIDIGVVLQKQGDLPGAVAAFRKAIELNPKEVRAHLALGNNLERQNELDEAIACYRTAIELAPNYAAIHFQLGHTLCESSDFSAGAAAYRQGLELQPDAPAGWYHLANAHLALGQRDAYRQVCADMLQQCEQSKLPNWPDRILYACLSVADALPEMSVLFPLAKIASNGKPDPRTLGAALYRVGKYQEALVNLNTGSQDRAWDHLFLAMAHHQLGDAEKARTHLKSAEERMEKSGYPWTERIESESLHREAEALIKGTSVDPPVPQDD